MDNWEIYNYIKAKNSGSSDGSAILDTLINRSITEISNDRVTSIGSRAFAFCKKLKIADMANVASIGEYAFNNCVNLSALILKNKKLVVLESTNVFNGSTIASGTGYIYVPDDLVESYKNATNWSTYANQIKGLSELPE